MILEYGQLLSTAHRLLDGVPATWFWVDRRLIGDRLVQKQRRKVHWAMPGEEMEIIDDPLLNEEIAMEVNVHEDRKVLQVSNCNLYLASHMKHPGAIWCRAGYNNYIWLYMLFAASLREYTYRYGKKHVASRLLPYLSIAPQNIPHGVPYSDPPQSMADEYKEQDAVMAYQTYYVKAKARFARWTNRPVPDWFSSRIPEYDSAHFCRTRNLVAATT